LNERLAVAEPGSYTARLAADRDLLAAKLAEEAAELAEAETAGDVAWEAADVLYFTLVKLAAEGLRLEDVARELDRRALAVTRRDGSRTFGRGEAGK
jgi:phosphoribosyl-ATP pyrophosphohydrolase